jgi:hypothetical protein
MDRAVRLDQCRDIVIPASLVVGDDGLEWMLAGPAERVEEVGQDIR